MGPKPRPGWPFVASVATLAILFAAAWLMVLLLHEFGTCGEDSDFSEHDYERFCGDGGSIIRDMWLIAGGGLAAIVLLGTVSVRRRAWWPAALLAVGLTVLASVALGLG